MPNITDVIVFDVAEEISVVTSVKNISLICSIAQQKAKSSSSTQVTFLSGQNNWSTKVCKLHIAHRLTSPQMVWLVCTKLDEITQNADNQRVRAFGTRKSIDHSKSELNSLKC